MNPVITVAVLIALGYTWSMVPQWRSKCLGGNANCPCRSPDEGYGLNRRGHGLLEVFAWLDISRGDDMIVDYYVHSCSFRYPKLVIKKMHCLLGGSDAKCRLD